MDSLDEATNVALVLRSGSLPINLEVEEIRAIGPTLGQDSIAAGTRAALIGGALVVATILLYYGPLFGGVLTFGLVLVVLFIFGALAGLGAVLTLPGLAGLVLTIGAAVDGNVISFERIKEELRAGKSLRLAMKAGFGNSLSAIIDANVTTLLAAAALYQYTSGPVRGFAITLAIGIIAAVFVNVVVGAVFARRAHPENQTAAHAERLLLYGHPLYQNRAGRHDGFGAFSRGRARAGVRQRPQLVGRLYRRHHRALRGR